jgi:hypothetical protein
VEAIPGFIKAVASQEISRNMITTVKTRKKARASSILLSLLRNTTVKKLITTKARGKAMPK